MGSAAPVQQTIFITSGGGHIGSSLIPKLLENPVKLILPTSNAQRMTSDLPSAANAHNVAVEEGSIKNPVWVEEIMRKHAVDTVWLCVAGYDEVIIILNLLDVMHKVGTVKHVAFLSAMGDMRSPKGYNHQLAIHQASHVIAKPTIEKKLQNGGYSWTTSLVGPALFFDNDLRSKESLLEEGYYDEPVGNAGIARVSVSDIAAVASNVLTQPEKWAGKKIQVGTKQTFDENDVAKLWSEALGKPIRVCGSDEESLNRFEEEFRIKKGIKGGEGYAWARDLRLMYGTFAKYGFKMDDEDYELLLECLGREPESYLDFVAQTAKSWLSS